MKIYYYYFLFALTTFIFVSCDKTSDIENQSNAGLIQYKGLNVCLPKNYDKSVLSLDIGDLQNILYSTKTSVAKSKVSSLNIDYTNITLTRMASLSEEIASKYPNTDSLTEADIMLIKNNFVGITDESIYNNIDKIDSFYTALKSYDLVEAISNESISPIKVKKAGSYDFIEPNLSSGEFWFLICHPALVTPIKNATEKARIYTANYFPNSSTYQDKGDAFRHAIWSALMSKYIGNIKSSVSEAIDRAKTFADKHESGGVRPTTMTFAQYKFDGQMDYHNNEQGRKYFVSVAWIAKIGLLKISRVRAPSEDQIASDIYNLTSSAKKVDTITDIDFYPNNLVHIVN